MDNVLITTAADGVLTVHRENCKKIEGRETKGVDEFLNDNPGSLTTAKKASCCKPTDTVMSEIEQAGWDALEAATAAEAAEPTVSDEAEADVQADADEDLIGAPADDAGDDDEDLIGAAPAAEPAKPAGKTAGKVAAAKTEAKELNGSEALAKVGAYLGLDLGKKPVFPGFGKAFKTEAKQSVYINSKGNADVRATDTAQADAWAAKENVERRSGNYVRVNLAAL